MKKRSSRLFVLALVATLVLGIGFATVSNVTLTTSGTAATTASDLKVDFASSAAEVDVTGMSGSSKSATGARTGALTANIAVTGFEKVGDIAKVTYTIENKEVDLKASVAKKEITVDKSDYFEVTTSVDTTPVEIAAATSTTVPGTKTVTINVKLIKLPIAEADSTANITVTFTASPVAKS